MSNIDVVVLYFLFLLENKQKAISLGIAAKKYAEKCFDFSVLIKQYEKVYDEVYMLNKKNVEK